MRRWLILALMTSLPAGVALPAQDKPAPADDKKDKPGTVEPDPEEPELRAALKALARALEDGNKDGIRAAMYAANSTEQKMLDAMAAMAAQIAELHKAAAKAFGDEEARQLADVGMEMGPIDDAEVLIDGDTATVRYAPPTPPATAAKTDAPPADAPDPADVGADSDPPPAPPMVLKKIDGRWRVPVAELSKDTTPAEIEQRLTDLDAQSKIIIELTGEIAQGKYKSADKAAEAWQGKMMQALLPRKAEAEKKPDEEKKPEAAKPD